MFSDNTNKYLERIFSLGIENEVTRCWFSDVSSTKRTKMYSTFTCVYLYHRSTLTLLFLKTTEKDVQRSFLSFDRISRLSAG